MFKYCEGREALCGMKDKWNQRIMGLRSHPPIWVAISNPLRFRVKPFSFVMPVLKLSHFYTVFPTTTHPGSGFNQFNQI